jgi:hypothetical protein
VKKWATISGMMDSPDAPFVKMTQAWRRCAYRWELHHLLRLCRLAVEAEYSDFGGSGISYGNQLILVARAA